MDPEHDGTIGSASEPYGTAMIMAVAASRPLLAPRPGQEDADTYLGRLLTVIDTVCRQAGKVSVGLLMLETVAK